MEPDDKSEEMYVMVGLSSADNTEAELNKCCYIILSARTSHARKNGMKSGLHTISGVAIQSRERIRFLFYVRISKNSSEAMRATELV